MFEWFRKIVDPLPRDQSKPGWSPNFYINTIRFFARAFITIFRLNSNNRFSTELNQMIAPTIDVKIKDGQYIRLVTGHGRLLWRANTLLTEEPMIIDWIDGFSSDDVFYDIGANIGCFSIYAAKTMRIQVYAFEPEINNMQLLYHNIYLNGLTSSCTIIPIATSNSNAIKPFFIRSFSKGDALHSIGAQASYLTENSDMFTLNTMCMRVDEMASSFDMKKPTKIKIDVDSNELEVVEGLLGLLESVSEIYIELDLDCDKHMKCKHLLESNRFEIKQQERIERQWNSSISNYIFKKTTKAVEDGF